MASSVCIAVTGLVSDESLFERGSDALLSSTAYARGESLPSHQLIPSSPHLSEADDRDLHELYDRLRYMCTLAQSSGIRIAFDAEQSWIQPCLDRLVDLLSAEFNASGSLVVYNTYQANTRQALDAVRRDLVRARDSGERQSWACKIATHARAICTLLRIYPRSQARQRSLRHLRERTSQAYGNSLEGLVNEGRKRLLLQCMRLIAPR